MTGNVLTPAPGSPGALYGQLAGYTLANARLTWANADKDLTVALEVTNLTTKYYYYAKFDLTGAGAGAINGDPGRPREWAVTVKKAFGSRRAPPPPPPAPPPPPPSSATASSVPPFAARDADLSRRCPGAGRAILSGPAAAGGPARRRARLSATFERQNRKAGAIGPPFFLVRRSRPSPAANVRNGSIVLKKSALRKLEKLSC